MDLSDRTIEAQELLQKPAMLDTYIGHILLVDINQKGRHSHDAMIAAINLLDSKGWRVVTMFTKGKHYMYALMQHTGA